MNVEIEILTDAEALARRAAGMIVAEAGAAVRARGLFTMVLSGGSTPKLLYSLLAEDPQYREAIPWEQSHIFWGDERHVPPDHPESNYRMATEAMLSKVGVPAANIHRIKSEEARAGDAADQYEQELRGFFRLAEGDWPRFDLVLLGLGSDGHTASLFPGTRALSEPRRLVTSNWVGKFYTDRITLTAPVFNQAAQVIFLVAGEDKAAPMKAVLEGPHEPSQLPAQLIDPAPGRLWWLLDGPAARRLAPAAAV